MTFQRFHVPPYPSKPHSSGQARVRISGKDFYLGVHGSEGSRIKYAKLVAEYSAGITTQELPSGRGCQEQKATVEELVDAFRVFAEVRYVKNGKRTSEVYAFKSASQPLIEFYSDLPVDDFGPKALTTCLWWFINQGDCVRKTANDQIARIRHMFKWGVSQEIVNVETWQRLKSVEGLKKGMAPDAKPVGCVAQDRVDAIRPHVPATIWAMIQMQMWTGMRPGEVCVMRTCDIVADDSSIPEVVRGSVWAYRPTVHKLQHHDIVRTILLGPQAQEVVSPWLLPADPDRFIFSPAETVRHLRARLTTSGRGASKRKASPKRIAGERYHKDSYGQAIMRGCEIAFGMPKELRVISKDLPESERDSMKELARKWRSDNCWTPNQLRHNAATLIRRKFGIEAARVILGHANISTTEIYTERDMEVAAKVIGSIG